MLNLKRIIKSTGYSMSGVLIAVKTEAAFQQELIISLFLLPLALLIPVSFSLKAVLVLSNFVVLIVELINTSMEEIVDSLFAGVHHSAKKAKDIGSAAVMISIII
ncbi:MAG: diacylglycerol kinase [Candidatus Theseobacter exili]|nr:diacylglycerol kinase [Candidatus Theseobacter exili]